MAATFHKYLVIFFLGECLINSQVICDALKHPLALIRFRMRLTLFRARSHKNQLNIFIGNGKINQIPSSCSTPNKLHSFGRWKQTAPFSIHLASCTAGIPPLRRFYCDNNPVRNLAVPFSLVKVRTLSAKPFSCLDARTSKAVPYNWIPRHPT